ncbi:MAG: Na+-transporting NADH:ubiquinone oxidoreductase subunit B, partial [Dinoroseobacter sp.]
MQALRNLLDKIEPEFESGGKYEKWYSVYEAVDTIFYSPGKVTAGASHVRDSVEVKRIMTTVWLCAFLPMFAGMYVVGSNALGAMDQMGLESLGGWRGGILDLIAGYDQANWWHCVMYGAVFYVPIYFVTFVAGAFWEVLFAVKRGHEINEGFFVTSILFSLTMPATVPLWEVALGISFGIVIGKEIFGGTGKNFLNPALTGRAFLYFAYPAQMSGDAVWTAVDGFSGATMLGVAALQGMEGIVASGVTW